MKKRLISMVLAVSMAVSIMPAPAFASGGQQPETVIGQEIDRQNSSGDYLEVSSLDQLTYINNECKVRLTKDIVMTKAVTVNNGNSLTIDLNGHTLTAAANSQAFRIQGGALTIEDSIGTGVIQGSGTVTGNGGAIWMSSSDSNNALTLTGGTIRGFTATDGGGVYVDGGSFEMSGGTISACNATNAGGGVYVSSGSFKMSGGSIEDCTAHEGAGVKVYASNGKTASFSMTGGEIQNCNTDGVSIYAIGSGTSEFTMTGGTIEDNGGYGVWVDNGSAVMSGGSVKGSERYDIYIGSRATLTVNNTQVGGTVLNMGKITGQGSAEFTGTVENSGYAAAGITGCKIHRIEHRSPYKGTIEGSTWDEYVYLLGYSWPTAKIPSGAGESISLKFPSYITPKMENTLEIPEGVTVTVDLAGKPVSADTGASDIKIINHGTLTLIDSGTDGTLSIPIENDGVLNANGGTVTGKVTNRGTIQATGTPVTQFTGTLVNQEGASVTAGDFRGCTITNNGGTIGGGAILDKPEPDPEQPGAGSEDGGAGAVIAALAVGTAVVGGGILLAHSYIQNNLPEGFAVPETRQELAVVLWNMAGKPEPASQQTYTDVQDEEVLKAVCWAVENELVTPETESTLGADVRVNRLQVIGAMYQTNKRKK
ncbi:MAG: right-handed parallel beta-helix repeat-containing protein [Faecalibacterium sp.]